MLGNGDLGLVFISMGCAKGVRSFTFLQDIFKTTKIDTKTGSLGLFMVSNGKLFIIF
jgi:hypothetical protein